MRHFPNRNEFVGDCMCPRKKKTVFATPVFVTETRTNRALRATRAAEQPLRTGFLTPGDPSALGKLEEPSTGVFLLGLLWPFHKLMSYTI